MAYVNGTVPAALSDVNVNDEMQGHWAMLRKQIQFLNGAALVDYESVVVTAAGDGTLNYLDSAPAFGFNGNVAETWTIAFTSSTAFTVTGSVSGAQTAGVVDTNYTSDADEIAFLIEQGSGGNEWANLDTIVFDVTLNPNSATNDQYEIMETSDGSTVFQPNRQVILRSIGLAGANEIYHGLHAGEQGGPPTNRWWIAAQVMTGHLIGSDFTAQPGILPPRYCPVWNGEINFWFTCNGRRYTSVMQTSSIFHAMFNGFIDTFTTEEEYPYPYLVGMETDNSSINWIGDNGITRQFIDSNADAYMRAPDGTLSLLSSQTQVADQRPQWVWPWSRALAARSIVLLQGAEPWANEHPLFPATVCGWDTTTVAFGLNFETYGVIPGVYGINGLSVSAGSIVTVDAQDYLVVNQIDELNIDDYWLLELL